MPLAQAIILAVVQGLTEFLPISSSAHLVLIPWFAGWTEPGLAFNVALHMGTLAAVLIYFLREWVELFFAGIGVRNSLAGNPEDLAWRKRLFWYLVIGTIPGAIVGALFEKTIEQKFQQPAIIATLLIAVGLLMWWADRATRLSRDLSQTTMGDALAIGGAQALALFPGVSRSGITITTGLFRGMTRATAARFSFLLSTPLIAGAGLKELPKLIHAHRAGTLDLPMSTLFIAIAVSAIVGYAVIAFFLRYLQTHTFKLFIVYRILLGIVVLLFVFLHLGPAR
jgi:undecaprenyl-diphosphatase